MTRAATESAERTTDTSPAIYRWEQRCHPRPCPRSGGLKFSAGYGVRAISDARFTGLGFVTLFSPALKCRVTFTRPLRGLCMFTSAALSTALAVNAAAQTPNRKPAEATRPVVVMSAQSLDDLNQKLKPGSKTEELIDSSGMQLRVAVMRETDKTGAAAEVHDASDDVYYVLEGGATLVLGGRLELAQEVEPGEWRSPRIIDGKIYEIKKGDLVVVPRGTPHQRSTPKKELTMILIKIYAEPLKPGPPKPTPTPAAIQTSPGPRL